MEAKVSAAKGDMEVFKAAKAMGFSDKYLAKLWEMKEIDIYALRKEHNIFAIAELMRRGVTVEQLHEITKITAFFLEAIRNIVEMESKEIGRASCRERV